MPQITQVPVPSTSSGTPAQFWSRVPTADYQLLVWNQDINNYVYVGERTNITPTGLNVVPIPPNMSFTLPANRNWFVIGSVTGIANLVVIPGGTANFLGITAGFGTLVIPSIQSPNFVNNVSGWQISKNGNAQFNNLTIRGTFFGTDFIINASGAFFYSGTPALGNLIVSIAPAGGTDSFGNTYFQGVCVYTSNEVAQLVAGTLFMGPPASILGTGGANAASISGSALGNAGIMNVSSGVTATGDAPASISLTSKNAAGGLGVAALVFGGVLSFVGGQTAPAANGQYIWVAGSGSFNIETLNGMSGFIPVTQTDTAVTGPVTGTSFAALSKIWSIPANDPQNGTLYRLTSWGNGTWGTTQEVLTFQLAMFGLGLAVQGFGATWFSVSTAFNYRAVAEILIKTSGSSGVIQCVGLNVTLTAAGVNALPVAGTQTSGAASGFTGLTSGVNTTIANTMTLQAKWASSTVGCTISGGGSMLERIAN